MPAAVKRRYRPTELRRSDPRLEGSGAYERNQACPCALEVELVNVGALTIRLCDRQLDHRLYDSPPA